MFNPKRKIDLTKSYYGGAAMFRLKPKRGDCETCLVENCHNCTPQRGNKK